MTRPCFFCKGGIATDEQWNLLLRDEGSIDIIDLRHFAREHKKEWQRFITILEGVQK